MSHFFNVINEDYGLNEFLYFVNHGHVSAIRDVLLLHMNIRSLNANLRCFESVFINMSRQPDFMVFTECWVCEDIETYRNSFSDYRMVFCSGNNKNGGVVLFCKNESVKITAVSENFLSNCDSLQISFDCGNLRNQQLICIYRSPAQDSLSFTDALTDHVKLMNTQNLFAVVGDFNMCKRKIFTSPTVEKLYDSLLENGLFPVIDTPTRTTDESCSIIDQIFISSRFLNDPLNVQAGNVFAGITDHHLQYLFIVSNCFKEKETVRPLNRIYSKKNIHTFIKELESLKFVLNEEAGAIHLYEEYDQLVSNAFEKTFPLVKVSRKMFKSKSWFNQECMNAFKKKTKLYRRFCKTKSTEDKIAHDRFSKYYKKLIRYTKNAFNAKQLDECGSDSKKVWNVLNRLLGKPSKSPNYSTIRIKGPDNEFIDDRKVADVFNCLFNEVGSKYGIKKWNNEHREYMNARKLESFYFLPLTEQEVSKIIATFDLNKSSNDQIPLRMFQLFPVSVIKRLTLILNKCVLEGIMPKKLKLSKIIPIFKHGSRHDCNNYRPISLLSYIDKILEKAMCSRLGQYLTKINFLCDNQFGFRAKHSTELALLSLLDRIYSAVDAGEFVLLISIDLRKAFEVIRHDLLLDKLENVGIRGSVLKWFDSYLQNRWHRTFVNNSYSDYLCMKTGVPEGSCLGPLLFLIYINDISNIIGDDMLNMFADDTAVITRGRDIHKVFLDANNKLRSLDKYFKANGIRINEEKTKYMLLCSKNKSRENSYHLYHNNNVIQEDECMKILGIHLDNKLTFNKHSEILISKLRKYILIFFRIRNSLSQASMLKIYYAHVYSILTYCILIYGKGNASNLDKLERLHKRILKSIFFENSFGIDERMKWNEIFSLHLVRRFKSVILGHKLLNDECGLPEFLNHVYKNKQNLNLRNNTDFITRYYRTNIGQRCMNYWIAMDWNTLPHECKTEKSIIKFKRKVKSYLLNTV